jgi:hypothetical protein
VTGGKLLERLKRQVGRRGAFLLFLAMLDVVYGYYILDPPKGLPRSVYTYPLLPSGVWGCWWLATAGICLAGAFMKSDRVAYGAAALIKTAWGLRFVYQWYLGVSMAWVSMSVWLVFAFIVLVIAGWPEQAPGPSPPAGDRDR